MSDEYVKIKLEER